MKRNFWNVRFFLLFFAFIAGISMMQKGLRLAYGASEPFSSINQSKWIVIDPLLAHASISPVPTLPGASNSQSRLKEAADNSVSQPAPAAASLPAEHRNMILGMDSLSAVIVGAAAMVIIALVAGGLIWRDSIQI